MMITILSLFSNTVVGDSNTQMPCLSSKLTYDYRECDRGRWRCPGVGGRQLPVSTQVSHSSLQGVEQVFQPGGQGRPHCCHWTHLCNVKGMSLSLLRTLLPLPGSFLPSPSHENPSPIDRIILGIKQHDYHSFINHLTWTSYLDLVSYANPKVNGWSPLCSKSSRHSFSHEIKPPKFQMRPTRSYVSLQTLLSPIIHLVCVFILSPPLECKCGSVYLIP